MQVIPNENFQLDKSVVALGMFDGVHIGHRVLLQKAANLAAQSGAPLVVCTFAEHPLRVIAPDKCPPMLTDFEERNELIASLGVDVLSAIPFTPEVMNMLPEEYVGHLVRRLHPVNVVCGYNHTFGKNGQGTPAFLEVLGSALGFTTSVVPQITLEGADVSSTAIRALLAQGDVDLAQRMLARPYVLRAELVGQDQTGTILRLAEPEKQQLPSGKYRVICADTKHRYPAVLKLKDDVATVHLPSSCRFEGCVKIEWLYNCEIDF